MFTNTKTLLFTTTAALSIALPSSAVAGEIQGTVIDSSDTVAIDSAEVTLVELGRVAVSQRDGSFAFGDVPAGTYTLKVRYVGAEPQTVTVDVPETGAVAVTLTLEGFGENHVLVVGQLANQSSALSRKREADGVSDVVTRDAIGNFPDQNAAESLRRVPGVNVLNDQGEGRFVSVRGLDPELVSTSLNGVRVPSPESDVRSVALDVISSDIIESIEVKKSLTPDMDADTIGASVEIKTTSAFDRRSDLLTAKVEGSYNEYSGQVTPKGSVDFATRLGENVGLSGGVSYYRREFETDNIEADDWEDAGQGPFATEVQYRDYDVERERISATLGLDFRVGDSTELYARGIYSQFDDHEYRRRLTFDLGDFDDDGPSSFDGTTATFDDSDEEFTIERDVKDRFERQTIKSVVIGGESDWGDWFAEYSASWAQSSEREDGSVDPAQFERDFEDDGLVIGFDYGDPRKPLFSVLEGQALFADPAGYGLKDIEFTALSDAVDEEYAAQIDLGRRIYLDRGEFTVQGGIKARWRDKTYEKTVEFYENDDLTLDQVLGEQTYRIIDLGPVPSKTGASDFFFANRDAFEFQNVDSAFDSAVEDYAVSEDVIAGYLLGRYDTPELRIVGGVRVENTRNDITGNEVTLIEEDGTLPNGDIATDDTVLVAPVAFERNYTDWFPSLTLRYEPQPEVVLRAAAYRSMVRPKLSKLAPRFAVEQNDDDEREGEFGNPDLEPYEAWNFDVAAEYYFTRNGAITTAMFYKDIKNYIVDTIENDGVYRGIAFDEAEIPINGESAQVFGIELGVAQALDFLPDPLDGFIVQANYTYTDAWGTVFTDGDASDPRTIPLPSTSRNTFNVALGYEKGPFNLRLAGTYRDRYLDEIDGEAEFDRYVDDHFQLDLSAKFRVTEQFQLFYEWVNINNAKYFAYNEFGGRRNLYQYEEYGSTMKFGLRFKY